MNLLFLDSIDIETYGGMEEWIRLVAEGLAARGHGVTVAGRPDSAFLERVQHGNSNIDALPVNLGGDFNPLTISALKRVIAERHIEVVVVNFNKDVRLGGMAARLEGDPAVVWSVGLDITSDKAVHRWLTPRLIDGVVVPSQSLKKQITARGYINPDIVEVVPIGIADRVDYARSQAAAAALRRQYGMPDSALVAVTSARFVEQKGHRYLLEAMPQIVRRVPDVRFLWLGDGPLQESLLKSASELGVAGCVHPAGMLPDVAPALAGSDLMIHPSVDEPFGIAVLEGMRAGLPIIASDVGGIPEVLGDEAGVLVPPGDVGAMVAAVVRLCTTKDDLGKLGGLARRRFETKFRYDAMIDKLEAYFLRMRNRERRFGTA